MKNIKKYQKNFLNHILFMCVLIELVNKKKSFKYFLDIYCILLVYFREMCVYDIATMEHISMYFVDEMIFSFAYDQIMNEALFWHYILIFVLLKKFLFFHFRIKCASYKYLSSFLNIKLQFMIAIF